MSIRRPRLAFESQFVQIPNEWMRDTRISRRARGLLAEIMTHDAGWVITIESLVSKGPEGRDAIRGAIKELEDAGYLKRERQRQKTGNQKFAGMEYVLQAPPVADDPRISSVGNSYVGSAYVGESDTKNTRVKEDQDQEEKKREPRTGKPVRRSLLPADFSVSQHLQFWALTEAPAIDLDLETKKFVEYQISHGTKSADWGATWRKWILGAVEHSRTHSQDQPRAWQHSDFNPPFDPYKDV
ncbi:hypothetical protein [Pseudarthrobacter sp. NPDC080039]|uniref:hypothetical protein n=1 Tax=unclassified Pseudarthrobacter TaxID=2647000 RepID=UPI00344B5C41